MSGITTEFDEEAESAVESVPKALKRDLFRWGDDPDGGMEEPNFQNFDVAKKSPPRKLLGRK